MDGHYDFPESKPILIRLFFVSSLILFPILGDSTFYASTSKVENGITPTISPPPKQPNGTQKNLIVNNHLECPSNIECFKLGGNCIECKFNNSCVYGNAETVQCSVVPGVNCSGAKAFNRSFTCKYCYQLDHWLYRCNFSTNCKVVAAPRQRYVAACSVKDSVLCIGRRTFQKSLSCNWTSGYKWTTALLLSITLGGFGVDRFYLGLWREGIGKLFSFGGLGVWTIVDVILIAVRYIGPEDGSLFIY